MSGPRMWPRLLPAYIRSDLLRSAEVAVYDQLQLALPEGWDVYYSRPWLGLTPSGGERDGECDFVVAHPDYGVLTVEVKGGGIFFDPKTDEWLSQDRHKLRHRIKNPIDQARKAKHALLKKVQAIRGWPSGYIRFRHGVIFPDATEPPGDLGADRPRHLFCCRIELRSGLAAWIKQRLSDDNNEKGPGKHGLMALEKLLAMPIALSMPLGHTIADDEQAIANLTPQQFYILNMIADLPRVAAGGGAGTGKTILACEAARRFAEGGKRTLLTCRGTKLAQDLARRMDGTGVIVLSFEELCLEIARSVGLHVGGAPSSSFAENEGPELLLRAIELDRTVKYDGIFVDEGQDFISHWWIALNELLVSDERSRFHVFFDTNQRLYGQVAGALKNFTLSPIHLTRNLRNTQTIHTAATTHYSGLPIYADGPPGASIEQIFCNDREIIKKTIETARRLVGPDAVAATDIALLVPESSDLAALKAAGVPQQIAIETIADFKGLECPVVIIAATRHLADQEELAYVALSRARTHLILVGDRAVVTWLAPAEATDDI